RAAPVAPSGVRRLLREALRGAAEKKASDGARRALTIAADLLADAALPQQRSFEQLEAEGARQQAALCELLRDAFGDPFRPAAFDTRWRTPAVLSLAQAVYEGRSFRDLPVLADALEDAGCDSADFLTHFRGGGPHARGCWALDLVLGRA